MGSSIAKTITALILLAGTALGRVHPPPQAAGYHLAFSDNFNSVDSSVWSNDIWYHPVAPAGNISANGLLTLSWSQGEIPAETDITTMARDKSKWTGFQYGYFETRMKWDVGSVGSWPAFWLDSVTNVLGTDKTNAQGDEEWCELDIFEGIHAAPTRYFGTVHDWTKVSGVTHDSANSPNYTTLSAMTDFSQFHLYGMLWEPKQVTFYFDNAKLTTVPTPAICDKQSLYMLLSMTEGVNWQEGNLTGVTAPKISATFDYVRAWKK